MATPKEQKIEPAFLHECFSYDAETGVLTWRERPASHFKSGVVAARFVNARMAGNAAGTVLPNGYMQVRVNDGYVMVHRVIWALAQGAWPDGYIDHINHVRADNRLVNLRVVSISGNARNASLYCSSTSGVTGVSFCISNDRWYAHSRKDGKQVNIGSSKVFDRAVAMRKKYEEENGFHENHGDEPAQRYWSDKMGSYTEFKKEKPVRSR